MIHAGSFTNKVRQALKELGVDGQNVTALDLADHMDLGYGKKHTKTLYSALFALVKTGEIKRTAPGQYVWQGRHKPPNIQERMWRILRARRTVIVTDLQELAGAREYYAREFVTYLARLGYVRKAGRGRAARWTLVRDIVEMPATKQAMQRKKSRNNKVPEN